MKMKMIFLSKLYKELLNHNIISFLSFLFTIIIFLPIIILITSTSNSIHNTSTTLSEDTLKSINKSINSELYIHTCLGALCCSFPLICNQLFDIQVIKNKSILLAQRSLILSVILPSLVIYQASVTGKVSTILYYSSTNAEEVLYFGAMISLHSFFCTSDISKILTLFIYFLFSLGVVMTSLYNANLILSIGNNIGLIFVIIGLIGIVGMCIFRIYHQLFSLKILLSNSHIMTIEIVYVYFLIGNLLARLIIFSLVGTGDNDARSAQVQPYFIIINTITVVLMSNIHSRQVTVEFARTTSRLEKKRNFVRYISHEIRTPLNCVQLGIELAISQLKTGKKRDSGRGTHTTSSAHVTSIDIENSPHLSILTDSPSPRGLIIRPIGSQGESMNSIQSCSEISPIDQSTIDMLEDANISCQTAVEILNDILSYDKLEANDMKLNFSQVNIKFLIEKCVTPFLLQARHNGVVLNYKGNQYIPDQMNQVNISVDINRFSQVIRNIISNALKFTPSGGTISLIVYETSTSINRTFSTSFPISTFDRIQSERIENRFDRSLSELASQKLDAIRIDISDTGPGLSIEQQKSLFNGVVQFDDPHAKNSNGAGLGLWISKTIIDLHGGSFSVFSEGIPGKGCIFSVIVPKDQTVLSSNPSWSANNSSHTQRYEDTNNMQIDPNLYRPSAEMIPIPEGSSVHSGRSQTRRSSKSSRIQPFLPPSISSDSLDQLHHPTDFNQENDLENIQSNQSNNNNDNNNNNINVITIKKETNQQIETIKPKKPIALCVDDSILNQRFLGKILEPHFEIKFAVNGLCAVEIITNSIQSNNPIDVIFMDNVMPVMDGLEATHKIRELGYSSPIIGVTGNCLPEQIEEFIAHGATTVLQKPLTVDLFRNAIYHVMGSKAPKTLSNTH